MPTREAHRCLEARRIIQRAYRDDKTFDSTKALRYELLGSHGVALVRLSGSQPDAVVDIRLARRQHGGRVIRLVKDNRGEFRSLKAVMKYLEALYAEYGGPNGEPPSAPAPLGSSRLRLVR